MVNILAGVDEIATETQQVSGWCYFVLNEENYIAFENEVKYLLSQSKIVTAFHGKKFKMEQSDEYKDFLKIIRKYTESSFPSLMCCTLNNPTWNQQYLNFCDNLFTNVLTRVGVDNKELKKITKKFVGPLFSFKRLTKNFLIPSMVSIE